MGLFRRLSTLVRGIFSKRVRNLEWRAPDVVFEEAYRSKRLKAHQLVAAVGDYSADLERQRDTLRRNVLQLEQVERQLEIAQKRCDHANGPTLLGRQRHLTVRVEQGRQALFEGEKRLAGLKQAAHATKNAVDEFDAKRHEMLARIRVLQAQRATRSIISDFFADSDDLATQSLVDRLQSEQHRMELEAEINGMPGGDFDDMDRASLEADFRELCAPSEMCKTSLAIEYRNHIHVGS